MSEIRYLVENVDEAIAFYTENLEFKLNQQFGAAMAIVTRGDLTLWLAGPKASARKPMSDGTRPEPGGWSRFVIRVDDLETIVARLHKKGVQFRNEITVGPGGKQILCIDPSGNPIELFESA